MTLTVPFYGGLSITPDLLQVINLFVMKRRALNEGGLSEVVEVIVSVHRGNFGAALHRPIFESYPRSLMVYGSIGQDVRHRDEEPVNSEKR